MDDEKARVAFFKGRIYRRSWPIVAVSASAYVGSATFAALHRQTINAAHETVQNLCSVTLILFWVIGPPLLFMLEYQLMSRRLDKDLPDIERFKYSQDLTSKLWLAGVGILIYLYAGKIPGLG